ncbi:helix-turn-helix domain-containing protein [Aliarcobacter cryaerophilus]|uniref:helix-turn-helix domain-containing protein n=1 Tax=Aliarcobacter cryaerophilus TaxID=28198 RepID=UPI003DA51C2E
MTAEDIIYKLYEFFKVNNNLELAELLKTTPQTISNWKTRNSISAIKKKCRELRIYNDIFGDIDNKILDTLNKEQKEEIKNSIDEDTMFHIQNLFTIAKRKNLLKELKTELSMMYLKYSNYDKDSKTEDGRSIFNDNIVFDALK